MSANAPNTLNNGRQADPADVVPLRRQPIEPDDGQQTGRDLLVKNALVLVSAGSIVALAVWLLA